MPEESQAPQLSDLCSKSHKNNQPPNHHLSHTQGSSRRL